jgi:NifU-like protein involved in Fe-S cluster formation
VKSPGAGSARILVKVAILSIVANPRQLPDVEFVVRGCCILVASSAAVTVP